jgi:hypothetical protein
MNFPASSENPLLHFLWKIKLAVIPKSENLGFIIGMIYPLELLALTFVKNGTSTKMIICEKIK